MMPVIKPFHFMTWRTFLLRGTSALILACFSLEAMAQEAASLPPQPPAASTSSAGLLPEALEKALSHTYQNNPQIKAQRKVLEQLDENVNQALSGWMPTASAEYQRGRQRNRFSQATPFGVGNTGGDWNYSDTEVRQLVVEQPLFRGGETVARTRSTENLVKAGRADLLNTEQEVLLSAITAYMDVVRDRSVLELSRNNVDVLRKQLQASRDRFEVGEVTRTDVAQSEARLARAQNDEILARGSLTSSIAVFERVVGYTPEKLSVPTSLPEIPGNVQDAVASAQESNPNLVSAEFRRASAENDIDVNVARILPDVSLRGTLQRQKGAGILGNADFDNDSLTVNVNVPLYQSGAEYSRVRAAKSRANEQRFEYSNVRDQVRQSVVQAWEDLETSVSAIKATEEAIRAAQIALEGVRQEQLYGARTILDVLDAEQELFSAEVNLVRAERDRIVAIFTLLARMGRLTPETLALDAHAYNTQEHYESVRYKMVGF